MSQSRNPRNLKTSGASDQKGFPLGRGSLEPRVRVGYVLTGNAGAADRTGARAELIGFPWKQDRYPKL